MRTWRRLTHRESCGYCGAELLEGASALEITYPNRPIKQPRYRGECCAGAAPPNLPDHLELRHHDDSEFLTRLAAMKTFSTRGGLRQFADKWMPYREAE